VSSSRFRRHQAQVLRSEGMPMDRVAELFGVTRQRVSQLLKRGERSPLTPGGTIAGGT
jgi:predicted transcriptional regulator